LIMSSYTRNHRPTAITSHPGCCGAVFPAAPCPSILLAVRSCRARACRCRG
jgi:hypothetical protein